MRKGFSSVFLVLILSSLILLTLVFAEVSASAAAESCAENLCFLTGRSLLSEYKKELFDRYGLFMIRSYEDELSELAEFYLRTDLSFSSAALRLECAEARVRTEQYPGLNTEMFLEQIEKTGALKAAQELLDGGRLGEMLKGITGRLSERYSLDEIERKLSEIGGDAAQDESEGEERERRKQARQLRSRLKEASKEGSEKAQSKASVPASLKKKLPSALLGYKGRGILLFSGGIADLSLGDVALGEYILSCCSDLSETRDDTLLKLETEYILYGSSSDSLNQKLVRNSLRSLRYSLNLCSIFAEPKLLSIVSTAAAAFPLLPHTLTTAALGLIWAGIETRQDLVTLFDGGIVPVIKDASDFATDLKSFIDKGKIRKAADVTHKYGSYRDYLRLLLLLVPEQEKAARLMDVMEMNVSEIDGTGFSFRDYAYGLDLKAGFIRKRYVSTPFGILNGIAYVEQTHRYR